MSVVLIVALAWLLGEVVMEGLLWSMQRLRIVRSDNVRSIGLLWRHTFRRALLPGVVIHLAIGAVLTALVAIVLAQVPGTGLAANVLLGAFFGAVVGMAASLAFSELLPQESFFRQFPRRAIGVATATVPGYLVYGLVVALVLMAGRTAVPTFG